MRTSIGAFALIRRATATGDEWLAQWNERRQAYNFAGGHKRSGESFRECCAREVTEELGLVEGRDFSLAPAPVAHLEYTDWSRSAQAETAYTLELFVVELLGGAARAVEADDRDRWL